MRWFVLAILSVLLSGCGDQATSVNDYLTRQVRLPNGTTIRAESMVNDVDMRRGMMFRESLAPDRGMLFFHAKPGRYPYWMYQVRIPLDIVWLDADRRIVEIAAGVPPCKTAAHECPSYGGHADALFVLELAGGMAANYGLRVGDTLRF